jgi:RHS repeat-associated protein
MEAHANYPNCAPQCPWKGTYSGSTLVSQEAHFYGIGGRELAVYSLNGSGGATQTATKAYFKGKMVGVNGNAFVADRLGCLRYSNGQPASFYPYGEDKGTRAANDQVKFATYTRDSVDLYDYASSRYYYFSWGRFLSPDPYSGSAHPINPQSWNRYVYALGDPVNAVDPSGYGCIIASGVLADDGGGCISTGKPVYGDGTINPDGNTPSVSATLTFPAVEPDTLNSFAQQAFTMVGNNYVLIIPSFGIGASLGVDAYGGLGPGTYGFSEQASAGGGIYFDGHSDSLTAGAFLEGGGNPGIPTGIWPGTAPSDAGPNFNFGVG